MRVAGLNDGEGELEGVSEVEEVGEGVGVFEEVGEGVGVFDMVGEGVDEAPGGAQTVSLVGVQPAAVMGHVLHGMQPPAAALVPVELHVEPATQAVDEEPGGAHTASAVAVQGLT